jgi:hypothetical protein
MLNRTGDPVGDALGINSVGFPHGPPLRLYTARLFDLQTTF